MPVKASRGRGKKEMEETDRKNDCIVRDSGTGRRRERDKRDADIKLEARQIKREGKKLKQRRAGKKNRKLAARVTQQQW